MNFELFLIHYVSANRRNHVDDVSTQTYFSWEKARPATGQPPRAPCAGRGCCPYSRTA